MRTYSVAIVGETELIMHWDNLDWADQMSAWQANPANAKKSKKGDDRTPPWRWLGCLYHDGEFVAMPQDNLMRALMEGGAMVPVPGGKSGKTFKAQTQSGLLVAEPYWRLQVSGHEIPVTTLLATPAQDLDFVAHKTLVAKHGFELLAKRAKVGAAKHVRVRPMFRNWSLNGSVHVMDDQITEQVLFDVLRLAGLYKGLGDWRPGSKTPGPWGRFTVSVKAS